MVWSIRRSSIDISAKMARSLTTIQLILSLFMVPALSLRLLLIRHAQSQNNAIASQVATKYSGSGKSMQEMRAEFEMLRSFEPGLSETGALQADALAVALKVEFGALQNSSVPVYCSPMVRTILTSQPWFQDL